jgi:NitT/TauT family transport system substrate-binding protein
MMNPHLPARFGAPARILALALALFGNSSGLFAGDANAAVPIVMQLDWKANVQFAGLLLAKENGWYAEAGLDVQIRPADQAAGSVVQSVLRGPNAIGSGESSELLSARGDGAPIKAIATMFQGSPMALISLEKTGIKDVSDLIGKRIGIHGGGQRGLDIVFANAGIAHPAYELKEIGYDLAELKSGAVDAAQGYLIDEFVSLQVAGIAARAMADHGYHAYSQVFFVSEDFLRRDPQSIRKFLEVSFRGWRSALADPESTAKMVIAKYEPGAGLAYQVASLRAIGELMTRESPEIGQMSMQSWEASAEMCRRFQVVQRPAAASDLVDLSLLRTIYPSSLQKQTPEKFVPPKK